jgi:hypothetical protein
MLSNESRERLEKAIDIGATDVHRLTVTSGKIRVFGNRRGYGGFVDLNEEEFEILAKICTLTHGEIVDRYNDIIREDHNTRLIKPHKASTGYSEITIDKQ